MSSPSGTAAAPTTPSPTDTSARRCRPRTCSPRCVQRGPRPAGPGRCQENGQGCTSQGSHRRRRIETENGRRCGGGRDPTALVIISGSTAVKSNGDWCGPYRRPACGCVPSAGRRACAEGLAPAWPRAPARPLTFRSALHPPLHRGLARSDRLSRRHPMRPTLALANRPDTKRFQPLCQRTLGSHRWVVTLSGASKRGRCGQEGLDKFVPAEPESSGEPVARPGRQGREREWLVHDGCGRYRRGWRWCC